MLPEKWIVPVRVSAPPAPGCHHPDPEKALTQPASLSSTSLKDFTASRNSPEGMAISLLKIKTAAAVHDGWQGE